MTFTLQKVTSREMTQEQWDQVVGLCSQVFHLDYSYYMNLCPQRVHVLGYVDGRLVSHALWLERRLRVGDGPWLQAAYVEGVVTQAPYRRQGFASAVMRRIQDEIRGYQLAGLSPAVPDWYAGLGWERWRGPLFIVKDGVLQATPDGLVMIHRTPCSPQIDLDASLTGEWRPFELW
jgi:aminoglycoside 2'-N-acetyltransferase I